MREIKFRVWDKNKKKWLSQLEIGMAFGVRGYHPEQEWSQYTGLKDKNGKECYIGDIIKVNNDNYDPDDDLLYVGIVLIDNTPTLGFDYKPINPTLEEIGEFNWDSHSFWHIFEEDTTEIIDNIYESPKLLETP